MSDDILLEVKGLKTYFFLDEGIVKAVDGVDFDVKIIEFVMDGVSVIDCPVVCDDPIPRYPEQATIERERDKRVKTSHCLL